ncbi:MAG: DUF2914 domain-containing protein [Candidatus Latescibacterota bacterium]|nr:MAG: DUF2914 domain-containing protein [Candidatus Latescibacterota bacterium]
MRRTLLFALCVVFAVSLAFAQAGPKKEEKAKPDSTKAEEKAKTDEAKSKDTDKEKAKKEKDKEKGKSDEAKKQEKKVEKTTDAKSDEAKAKTDKADKQQDKPKTEEAKKEKSEGKKTTQDTPEDKPGKQFAGKEPASGHLKRAMFTTAVEDREPVGSVDSLSTASEQIMFFTEIVGLDGHTVTHRWVQGGEVRAEVPINVGGPRWRAYSSKKMLPTWVGEWVVEVVDTDGSVLGKKSFVYYSPE